MRHLRSVYATFNPVGVQDILQDFNKRIPVVFQGELEKNYTTEEVKQALFQMDPLKSPIPYGFSACFY